ncbi:MAG TPA: S8 family serine peptidase, partial [Tepidisphaeraceae bacterium]|nr:S8 family serine peptidase [Tepidisphaeraceae bacterium]
YPNINGRGQLIVDIDSGINFNHPKLAGRIWTNPGEIAGNHIDDDHNGKVDDIHGWDFVNNDNNPADDQGHGTMTAGYMVANRFTNTGNTRGYSGDGKEYQGVAAGAQVIPLKVIDSSLHWSTGNVEKALQWVVANYKRYGIDAINMSLSVSYDQVKDELATLWNGGVFIGASSGNGYNYNNVYSMPAGSSYAMSVAAENQNQTIASISSRGPSLDLAAPGSQVPYLDRGSTFWPGGTATSYAAPFGTAAGALIKQVNPNFSMNQIVSILHDSGHSVYDPISKQTYKGLDLDSAIALAYSRSGQAAPAPAATTTTTTTTTSTRSAFNTIQAESFNMQSGGVAKNSTTITSLDSNDWVGYKGVNFGSTGATKFIASIGIDNAYAGRAIFVTIDGPLGKGKVLGTLKLYGTGGWNIFKQQSIAIARTTGVHDVYLTFGGGSSAGNFDWFKFA